VTNVVRFPRAPRHANLALEAWAELKTIMGVSLKGSVPPTTFLIEEKQIVPDFFGSGGALIASRNAKALLERAGVKAEFFPITMEFEDSRPSSRCYFVNVLEVIDCVDWEKSTVIRDDRFPIVRKIEKLVLTDAGAPLFRLKGLEFLLCCSDEFRALVLETKCSGLGFWSADEYVFPPPPPEPHEYQW
jgi:hypothetical protein